MTALGREHPCAGPGPGRPHSRQLLRAPLVLPRRPLALRCAAYEARWCWRPVRGGLQPPPAARRRQRLQRLALRTQQVIAYESGVSGTADPLGGAYAIEALTDEIERQALDYLARIDSLGGMLSAIEAGFVQREIEQAAYQYQKAVESGEAIVVGVNRFTSDAGTTIPTLRIDPAAERAQIARVQRVRAERNAQAVQTALLRLTEGARTGENLMPPILAAVEAMATLGEIADALRSVFGEYTEAG